ncbi:hypothetical protein, partial [Leucobacter sp. M11]|uniref:hypothetical protein n=1 Tax=Leucobacter sp. M11 TaxID=2993565 RepID=UPI002D7FA1CA
GAPIWTRETAPIGIALGGDTDDYEPVRLRNTGSQPVGDGDAPEPDAGRAGAATPPRAAQVPPRPWWRNASPERADEDEQPTDDAPGPETGR